MEKGARELGEIPVTEESLIGLGHISIGKEVDAWCYCYDKLWVIMSDDDCLKAYLRSI
ncbi:hypothetical protein PILCRDRAFT_823010 [Piloderma croceum F 1598]|jgi:hypothetical protein|uniref:Uncharacterized protein n=1 Tax=Piloderma croceum (strain F 1598) TaxID=765440 RepID=A0A0C3BR78_PILCF|nr:hypothetical protein PILCRDRAFT_823010 [Piloderma croceum F 1598]